jgi:hypothetical protein
MQLQAGHGKVLEELLAHLAIDTPTIQDGRAQYVYRLGELEAAEARARAGVTRVLGSIAETTNVDMRDISHAQKELQVLIERVDLQRQ